MNLPQEIYVNHTEEQVSITFVPSIHLRHFMQLPMPEGKSVRDYTLGDFPVYGNQEMKINSSVFKTESKFDYVDHIAQYLGECVVCHSFDT